MGVFHKDASAVQPTDVKENPKPALEAQNETSDAHSLGVKYPTTYLETLFHLVKGNIGSGMFGMGYAFKNAGLFLGLGLTIFLGIICTYGCHIVARSSRELTNRKKRLALPSYPELMEEAFQTGPKAFQKFSKAIRLVVNVFTIIAQLGFCSSYFVFIASTVQTVLLQYGYEVNTHVIMAIILVPMGLTGMIKTLKFLVPFSVLATFLTFLAVILTLYLSVQDLPAVTSRAAVASWTQLPLFFGSAIYSFEGINIVLPVQNEMKSPEKFGGLFGVLNVGMSIVTSVLVVMGFIGFLKYGDDVEASLTLNLEAGVFSTIVQATITVGIFFSYALQFHVIVVIMWPQLVTKYGPFKRAGLVQFGLRVILILVTFLVGEVVPQLSLFMSLIGSVSSTALVLVIPCLCDFAMNWGRCPGPNYVMDFICLVVAVVGFTTGVYCSMRDLIAAFFN